MRKRTLIILKMILCCLLLASCGAPETETAVVDEPAPVEEPVQPVVTSAPQAEAEEPPSAEVPTTNLTNGCVTDYQEGINYFPNQSTVTYSSGFTIEYFDHYKLITVLSPFAGAETTETYVLVQCGTPLPEGFADATIVETPIDSFVSLSTSYLPYLAELDLVDSLVAVDNADFVSTEAIRAKAAAGELVQVGSGAEINVEQVIDLEPDLVMAFASGLAEFDAHPKLREAGINVALNADFLDTNPLGRTEWVKFIAAFYNLEATANSWFSNVEAEYVALTELAATADEQPTVFVNSPFEGTWYMSGGESFAAQLLEDAGANYLWSDDPSTGALFLDFETVFDEASEADYWLNVGFFNTLADLENSDSRYAEFAAFKNGRVYNNDARTNEFGGNDYFEGGVANPHLLLADLIKIFHPELLPDHQFVYYRLME